MDDETFAIIKYSTLYPITSIDGKSCQPRSYNSYSKGIW